jgi:hypothetical protein
LSRRIIADIFSNFTDVLNLSSVMLSVLEDAVQERSTRPVPLGPRQSEPIGQPNFFLPASPESTNSSPGRDAPRPHPVVNPGEPVLGHAPSSRPTFSRQRTSSARSNRYSDQFDSPPLHLGQSLLPILPFLKQYSLFIAHFSSSIDRLADLEQPSSAPVRPNGVSRQDRARWSSFCARQRCRRIEERGAGRESLGLSAMLLNVVQRVPRYKLLLTDINKYTGHDHHDWPHLARALELVEDGRQTTVWRRCVKYADVFVFLSCRPS